MYFKQNIPNEPFIQIWTHEMEQITHDTPFGKPCMFCFEELCESDHLNAKPILNNHFLRLDYNTPEQYLKNVVVCCSTYDCFYSTMHDAIDHFRHYAHRGCYETYIIFNEERYVLCPYIRSEYNYVDGYPLQFVFNRKHVFLSDARFEQELLPGKNQQPAMLTLDSSWVNKNNKLLGALTKNEKNSLYAYTRWFYIPVNEGLRKNHITEYALTVVKGITDVLNRAEPYPTSFCFYRAVTRTFSTQVLSVLREGDVMETKGFNSQTIRFGAAANFGDHFMILCYPAGSRLLYLPKISQHPNEHELITYPNQLLVYVKKRQEGIYTFYYFDVQYRVVDVYDLIREKMLFVSYNYDVDYDKIHEGLDDLFSDEFHIDRSNNKLFILSTSKKSIEYYEEVVSSNPSSVLYLTTFLKQGYLTDLKVDDMQHLYLRAIASDVDMVSKLKDMITDTASLESVLREQIVEDGWMGDRKYLSPELAHLALQNNRTPKIPLHTLASEAIKQKISINTLPSSILENPNFILEYLRAVRNYVDTPEKMGEALFFKGSVLFSLQPYITENKYSVYLKELVDVYFEMFSFFLQNGYPRTILDFSVFPIPVFVLQAMAQSRMNEIVEIMNTHKSKKFTFTNAPKSFQTSSFIVAAIQMNIENINSFQLDDAFWTDDIIDMMLSLNIENNTHMHYFYNRILSHITTDAMYLKYMKKIWKIFKRHLKLSFSDFSFSFSDLKLHPIFYKWVLENRKSKLIQHISALKKNAIRFKKFPNELQSDHDIVISMIEVNAVNAEEYLDFNRLSIQDIVSILKGFVNVYITHQASTYFTPLRRIMMDITPVLLQYCHDDRVLNELYNYIDAVFSQAEHVHQIRISSYVPLSVMDCFIQHRKRQLIDLVITNGNVIYDDFASPLTDVDIITALLTVNGRNWKLADSNLPGLKEMVLSLLSTEFALWNTPYDIPFSWQNSEYILRNMVQTSFIIYMTGHKKQDYMNLILQSPLALALLIILLFSDWKSITFIKETLLQYGISVNELVEKSLHGYVFMQPKFNIPPNFNDEIREAIKTQKLTQFLTELLEPFKSKNPAYAGYYFIE